MEKLRKLAKRYYFRQVVCCWMIFSMAFILPLRIAMANPLPSALPDGFVLVEGTGIPGTTGNTMLIQNISNGAIFRWDGGFNIGELSTVDFAFINAGSSVLNRDVTGNMSEIYGTLLANGNVFIVNPAGVVFGASSSVNVNQLIASSLNITNENFIKGRYEFTGSGMGDVANYGHIEASEGVALIGQKVLNAGVITTGDAGFVVMTAGDKVLLTQPGSQIVVEMSSVSAQDGEVINEGQIEADNGRVILAAGDLFSMAAEIGVSSAKIETGTGRVVQSGDISADGGSIALTAADEVILTDGSLTSANGGINGDGGEIIVFSGGLADFQEGAKIEVKGGTESGDGGFVEIS